MSDKYLQELDAILSRGGPTEAPQTPAATPAEQGSGDGSKYLEELDAMIAPAPQAPPSEGVSEETPARRGYASVFADAVRRNAAQMQAAIPTLRGLAAEAGGDQAGAEAFAADAAALQAQAPEQYQEFSKIRTLEDFSYWATEKFGENILTMPLIMAGGGIGALVGRGLLSPLAGRYLSSKLATQIGAGTGAFLPSAGLETADTAESQRALTGSYQPGVSLTAGALKGSLEMVTPLMLNRWVKEGGKDVLKAMGSGAVTEGATELLQNETDVWARRYSDPKFDPWSADTWLQRAESLAAGTLVGGGFSAAASGAGNIKSRLEGPREFSAEELAELEGESPVSWIRKKFQRRTDGETQTLDGLNPEPKSAGLLGPMAEFGRGSMTAEQMSRQEEWLEKNTQRFIVGESKGEGVKELLNSTDANTRYADSPLHFGVKGPPVYQVAQGALIPANITSGYRDAGWADPQRDLYFLPGTSPEEQAQLTERFKVAQKFLREETELGKTEYRKLLGDGLRVVPRAGGSLLYVGQVYGREAQLPKDQRTDASILSSGQRAEKLPPQADPPPNLQNVDLLRVPSGAIGVDWSFFNYKPPVEVLAFPQDWDQARKDQYVADIATGRITAEMAINDGVYMDPIKGPQGGTRAHFPKYVTRAGVDLRQYGVPGMMLDGMVNAQRGTSDVDSPLRMPHQPLDKSQYNPGQVANADSARVKAVIDGELPWITELFKKLKVPMVRTFIDTRDTNNFGWFLQSEWKVQFNAQMLKLEDVETIKSVMYHEYGHAVTLGWFSALPVDIQQTIWGEFRLQSLRSTRTGDNSNITSERSFQRGRTPERYFNSFVEYLAEQFRRYAHITRFKEGTDQDKALFKGHQMLIQYWAGVAANYNNDQAKVSQLFAPGREFMRWMDYLESGNWPNQAEANKAWTKMAISGVLPELYGNQSIEEMVQIVDQVIAEHGPRLMPEGVGLERGELGIGEIASTSPDGYKVRLTAAAARYGAEGVLSHELIHVLKKMQLIEYSEWQTLVGEARQRPDIVERVNAEYRPIFLKQQKELEARRVLMGPYSSIWLREQLEEEMVAELMRDYVNGLTQKSAISKIFDKILAFLQRLWGRQQEVGLETPAKIMSAIWSGEVSFRSRLTTFPQLLAKAEARREAKVRAYQNSQQAIADRYRDKTFGKTSREIEEEVVRDVAKQSQKNKIKRNETDSLGDGTPNRNMRPNSAQIIPFPKLMTDQSNAEFEAFLKGPQRNAWIEVENGLRLYVRKSARFPGVITLASMESENPGSGQLTKFLDKNEPNQKFEVENILNERLIPYLKKRGYKIKYEGGLPQARKFMSLKRLRLIYPDRIYKVNDQMWVAREKSEGVEGDLYQFRFFKPPKGDISGMEIEEQLEALGQELGYVELQSHGPRGYEVEYVNVKPQFRRQGMAAEFYAHIGQVLKVKMQPSGILTPEGYAMWVKRDPTWLRYHVQDSVDKFWYSPNYIRKMISYSDRLLSRADSPEAKVDYRQQKARWERLFNQVDSKAWNDPQLKQMFMSDRTNGEVWNNLTDMGRKELEAESPSEFSSPPPLGFSEAMQGKMAESQARNAQILRLPFEEAAPAQPETRQMKKVFVQAGPGVPGLAPIAAQADRIGWFSKRWWGIKQLFQQNPHIHDLRNYVNTVEQMQNERANWLSRADTTARDWDGKVKSPQERKALADMFFWLTEMEYRSPQEKTNNVVRHPTPAEVGAYFAANGIGPEGQAVYAQVNQDFQDFLREYETIAIANVNRIYANNPQGLQQALTKLQADLTNMRKKPYFPMTRFGEWTVLVKDQNGQNLGFWAFSSKREQESGAREIARQYPGTRIRLDRLPENVMEFQGLPPGMISLIKANMTGLTPQQLQWLDAFELQQTSDRSFKKRWLERKGTEGYSLDAQRAYAHYFMMGSNYLMRLKYKEQLQATVSSLIQNSRNGVMMDDASAVEQNPRDLSNISWKRRQIIDYVQTHQKYVMEGGQDFAKTKALITLWYLGFSPVAAATNFSQLPLITWPILSQRFGTAEMTRSFARVNQAIKASAGVTWANAPWPGYEIGRQEMFDQGRLDAGQAQDLGAFAEGNNLVRFSAGTTAQRALRKFSHYGMWMFQQAERFNRELTYAMTFEMAMKNPNNSYMQTLKREHLTEINRLLFKYPQLSLDEAAATIAAKDMIDRTQFNYSPYNRPAFLRGEKTGGTASAVLMFYQFMQNVAYTVRNDPAWIRILVMTGASAGLMGLPGAEELDEVIGMLARNRGWNFKPSVEIRRWVHDLTQGTMYDTVGPDIVLRGLSRYGGGLGLLPDGFWAPRTDFSGNLSMGHLSPGGVVGEAARMYGSGTPLGQVGAGIAEKSSGAGLGYMLNLIKYLATNPFTSEWKENEKLMPRSMKAISKAIRYGVQGKETLRSGATIAEFDIRDPQDLSTILLQALGGTPRDLTKQYEYRAESRDVERYYQQRKNILYMQRWKAIQDGNPAEIQDTTQAIVRFNEEVARAGRGSLAIPKSKLDTSIRQRSRQKAMEEQGLGARKSSVPIYRENQDIWGTVRREKVK
jgi:hypothetical protein